MNFVMSSMTGSLKKPWVFKGCQVDWMTSIGCPKHVEHDWQFEEALGFPGLQVDWVTSVACPKDAGYPSVSLVTLHDKVKISVSSDEGTFPYGPELLEGVVRELTSYQETN
eukprot:CAMPEP_0185622968 /NCGR_PEP_ID=MMETSP0436-20130131/59559_1 /TAXON_ID=626734 ORGANISM="Favella taraikaensis, Strain Fe Narragansett Bay" /NCGR_SAMPLE_ID=MMETSP0436 /ASSEMBLY_ACC=CAM_ASM_000390 /LENGTH=110 /DNA_ID=CAMNT_0028264841 /DNA_START=1239 /DNA_END=1575 /DNA_ORIENTATION=+